MNRNYLVPIAIVCAVSSQACCKPATMDAQKKRYAESKDKLDVLASKNPSMKADIQAKLAEFDKDFKAAEAKGNADDAGSVVFRMQEYERKMSAAPAASASASPTAAASGTARPTPGSSARPSPSGPAAPPGTPGGRPGPK